MVKKLLYILFFTISSLLLNSCREDIFQENIQGNLPEEQYVVFEIYGPEENLTRSSATQRRIFKKDDVIHVLATFKDNKNSETKSYGALKLTDKGKWEMTEGSYIVWPPDAVEGSFKAYFVPNSNGILQENTHTDKILLSNCAAVSSNGIDLDPLEATAEGYKYGHAVELQFKHACTYLTFENLDPGVSDFFWLVKLNNNPEENQMFSILNNAYYLELSNQGEGLNLEIKFLEDKENAYGEETYVSGKTIEYNPENPSSSYVTRNKVSFFLEPGDYSKIELRTTTNYPYLSLKSDEKLELQSNNSYIVDAVKSKGVTYTIEEDENWEDDEGFEVNVQDFIEAVVKGSDYTTDEGTRILESISNGVRLLRNVKFPDNQDDYDNINWNVTPDFPNGMVFEGDYHYISNVKYQLFYTNSGTIQNLGLKDVNSEIVSKYGGHEEDRGNRGIVCQWNRAGGLIHNIRIDGFCFTIYIKSEGTNQTHSAGGICGTNTGTISDISYKGDYSITLNNEETTKVDAQITFGGITGQNVGNIYRVSPLGDGSVIYLYNNCKGDGGVFSFGGAVGFCSGIMENISLPNVNIDGQLSDGYQQYTGGLVGRLRGSSSTNSVSGCTVGGTVNVGHVSNYESFSDSYLYTGGLAGSCMNYIVRDCATTCSVNGNPSAVDGSSIESNSRYATGGVFGAVLTNNGNDENILKNNTGWNQRIQGPGAASGTYEAYIGRFAGIVPEGKTWNNYVTVGNKIKVNSAISNEIGVSKNIDAGSVDTESSN